MDFDAAYAETARMLENADILDTEGGDLTSKAAAPLPSPGSITVPLPADPYPLQITTITYAVEPYETVIAELQPLFVRHWAELALWQDAIKLDPNYKQYAYLAQSGRLRMYIARELPALDGPTATGIHGAKWPVPQGRVVGYAVFLLGPHIHYQTDIWATNDIFWVLPERRGAAIATGLFDFVEDDLRARKVSVMRVNAKAGHPAAAAFLGARYAQVEIGYGKLLKETPHE